MLIFCTSLDTRGRAGLWYWLQDIYDSRTGDFVRDSYQLATWSDLLDNDDVLILSKLGEKQSI